MKDKLNALTESVSLSDAEKLADELASFDDDKLTDEEQQRILSSVMRKAGFEMNNTNSVITAKRNITSRPNSTNEEQSTGRIQLRRGGAIAACIAIIAAGGVIFSLNRNMHNTVPNNDRDSSIYNEAVTTDPEDDKESSTNESETDTENIINDSTADNNDSKTDNKKDAKTDNRNDNESVIVVDANKENNKDNNINENKTDDTSSLKDRIHEDVQLKLYGAYPEYSVDKLNENRYILYKYEEYGDDYMTDYMIYDAPSDSVINTFRSEGRPWETLDNKFVSFSEPLDDDGYYNIIKATIFDENGNAVYKYDINAKEIGIDNNVIVGAEIKFTPDGRKMIVAFKNGDDITVDNFYCIDYENQKKAKKIAEKTSKFNTNSDGYSVGYNVSNGLMLVDRFYNDEHHEVELINLDPKSDQITEPYSIYNGMSSPWVVTTSDTIYSSFDKDHFILAITTENNGNINVGGRNCTITRYELGGCANLSLNGIYASSAYITENGKIKCTVYEVSDGRLNELRSKEIDLTSPEYDYIISTILNEETGDLSIYRQKDAAKQNYPNIDCKTDEVNMFR